MSTFENNARVYSSFVFVATCIVASGCANRREVGTGEFESEQARYSQSQPGVVFRLVNDIEETQNISVDNMVVVTTGGIDELADLFARGVSFDELKEGCERVAIDGKSYIVLIVYGPEFTVGELDILMGKIKHCLNGTDISVTVFVSLEEIKFE